MVTERIHGETYKHKVADIEGYVDPTTAAQAVVAAHKIEADAHAAGVITNTSTAYGRGLATTDNTVQKIADRVNANGTPQFITDKSKCNLLLDFKDGLTDKTRGINPVGYELANRWSNNFINDSTSEASATNISCTLKQFDGDEGLFGSGVAIEESRTNLLLHSDELTNAIWFASNCTVTLDRIENGRKIFKITATGNGVQLWQAKTINGLHNLSAFVFNPNNVPNIQLAGLGVAAVAGTNGNNKFERLSGSYSFPNTSVAYGIDAPSMTTGQSFYITSPQLEPGAFPTSYIATGATAVTRPIGGLKYPSNVINSSGGSISSWVRYNALYDWQTVTPFQFHNIGGAEFDIYYNPSSGYIFRTGGGYDTFTYSFTTNTWYHWVVKWNGSNIYIYINGVLVKTATQGEYVGKFNASDFWFGSQNSTISNFQIYNYALSDAEISQIYNSGLEGKPVVCSNPVNHQDIVREYAGTPNGNIMPMFFGESVYDTTNNVWYKSKKIDNSTFVNPAWLQLN